MGFTFLGMGWGSIWRKTFRRGTKKKSWLIQHHLNVELEKVLKLSLMKNFKKMMLISKNCNETLIYLIYLVIMSHASWLFDSSHVCKKGFMNFSICISILQNIVFLAPKSLANRHPVWKCQRQNSCVKTGSKHGFLLGLVQFRTKFNYSKMNWISK